MDSAPTSGAPVNGVTASNAQKPAGTISSPAGDGTVQQAQGAAPVAATTVQATPTGTTQSAPVSSQPQTEMGAVSNPASTVTPSTVPQGSAQNNHDSASNGDDADDVDTGTYEAEDSPIADGAGFYGEGTGNSFKEDEIKAATDDSMSSAAEPEAQSIHADVSDTTSGAVVETTTVPDAKQTGDAMLGQAQVDTTVQQSNEQAEEVSIPPVPQGIVLSNTSVNKLSDTNGTIRSASAGVFQLTREGLDEDTGKTVWRATLKQDAEGNPVTDYSANTFTFERTAKWNAQTRSYQPEGFDSVAKEVREAVDFRDISQSANQSRGSLRSDKPQNPPEHERFKRERNPRAYTDDARLTEGRRTTSTSRGGKHRAQRKSDTAKRRDNPLKNMDGFKTKR